MLPLHDLSDRIIGAAIHVHRTLGPGFLESIYEAALCLELSRRKIRFVRQRRRSRQKVATLDADATLIETHKSMALYSYKHFKAYQPLNVWWAQQQLVLTTEFRGCVREHGICACG